MATGLTVAEAMTKVRQFLDDTSTSVPRWTDAQVTDALADAVSIGVNRYATSGGDRFDLEASVTSSATDGTVSLSSLAPSIVKQVSVTIGTTQYRLRPCDKLRRGIPDYNARTLTVLYVREYEISATTSHPLIGVGSTAANSWRAFDRWICYLAALQLSIKDMESPRMGALKAATDDAEKEALGRATTPRGYEIPRREWVPLYDGIRWQYTTPNTLALTRSWY